MALHLPETMHNFGPCNGYCCFATERLNGTITALPTSGRMVKKELFLKFIMQQRLSVQQAFDILPFNMQQCLPKECVKLSDAAGGIAMEGDNNCQIQRSLAENFLSLPGMVDNDIFTGIAMWKGLKVTLFLKKQNFCLQSVTKNTCQMCY